MAEIGQIVNPNDIKQLIELNKSLQGSALSMGNVVVEVDKLKKQFEEVSKSSLSAAEKQKAYSKILNEASDNQKKIIAAGKQLDSQQKALTTTEAKLSTVFSQTNKSLIEQKLKLQDANKAIKDKLKSDQAEEGSLVRMRQKLSQLTSAYDNSGKRTKAAAKEIGALSKEIELAENETNRFQRGVGGYRNQLDGLSVGVMNGTTSFKQFTSGIVSMGKAMLTFLLSPAGLVIGALVGLVAAGKALIKNSQEFAVAASSLSAITGAVGDDLDFMKQKAIDFSKSSTSSATEILGAFEKVGSALPELLKNGPLLTEVTKNAIILSEATGGKLSVEDAARGAASALSAFDIPLTESARAINVLAAGSLAGSAEIMDLTESFKTGGAVAKASGLSLEEYVSVLETVSNATGGLIKAEAAGTQFKSMAMSLQKTGKGFISGEFNLRDALLQVNEEMSAIKDPIARAAYEAKAFGRYGITMGEILRQNVEANDAMLVSVIGTNVAFEQAKTQTNNLTSSYKFLSNTWKAFMLGFEDGEGIISRVWKGLVDFTRVFVEGMIGWQKAFSSAMDLFRSKESIAARDAAKAAREMVKDQKNANEELVKDAETKINALESILQREILDIKKNGREKKKTQEEINKEIQDAELKSLNEKLALQKKAGQDTIQTEQQIEGILAMIGTAEDKKGGSKDTSVEDAKKLADAQYKVAADAAQQEYDMQIMLIQATATSKEDAENKIFEFKKAQLRKTFDLLQLELDAFSGSELEKVAIQERLNKARYDLEKSGMEERIKLNEEPVKAMPPLHEKEIGLEVEKLQTISTANQQHAEEMVEIDQDAADKREAIIFVGTDAAINIQSSLFDFMDAKYAGDLERLEQKNDAGLLSDKEYAIQKAEIEIKQAKASRAKGIFEATIGVAQAVVNALQVQPFYLGLIMAATAGITGALQIASILSEPLPQMPAYFQGGKANGFGTVAERGRELGVTTTGEAILFNEPQIFAGNKYKGMHIYSNPETERMISQTEKPNYGNQSRSDDRSLILLGNIYKELKNTKRTIYQKGNDKPIGYRENNFMKIYLDRKKY
jgi:TP901 family phage tail tape measure protein